MYTKYIKKYEGKNIVIGTHGNIMVLLMNYFNWKYDLSFGKHFICLMCIN